MCMMLYAGTRRPIPRKEWVKEKPDICVTDLMEDERAVTSHFTLPEVQCIGSTSGCGCDFPHSYLTDGGWEYYEPEDEDRESEQYNREALADLLAATGESEFELYAVWWEDFAEPAKVHEQMRLQSIREPRFRFKEQGFYSVNAELPCLNFTKRGAGE